MIIALDSFIAHCVSDFFYFKIKGGVAMTANQV